MFQYASLVASEFLLRQAIEHQITTTLEGSLLTVGWLGEETKIDIDCLPAAEAAKIERHNNYYSLINRLLGRPQHPADYLDRAGIYFVQKQLDKEIVRERHTAGQVLFHCWHTSYRVSIEPEQPHFDYGKLTLCRALVAGYRFTECPQSHFWIYTPAGKERVTTRHNCDCDEFKRLGQCLHTQLVETAVQNRQVTKEIIRIRQV